VPTAAVEAFSDGAAGGVQELHDLRVAIELLLFGLGHGELLVDQAFEDLAAGGFDLLGLDALLAFQHLVDLVNGEFFAIHACCSLAGRLAFGLGLVAATGNQGGRDDDGQQRHQASGALTGKGLQAG